MKDINKLKVLKAISPIKPATNESQADKNFLSTAQKTNASKNLPPYYMVYFLLVDLLKFRNLGKSEKICWSVPIDYNGVAFLIEYRKFGLGIFAKNAVDQEAECQQIALLIKKGVKAAKSFFEKMAEDAVAQSKLNVVNNARLLFERFNFLLDEYNKLNEKAKGQKDKAGKGNLYYQTKRKADWLAISLIEAFFSWTEHVFIHIGILNGNIRTGEGVAKLASAGWADKYKMVFDSTSKIDKSFYDDLIIIRKQIRNFITHGTFGKEGQAFYFHSNTGAVPITMEAVNKKQKFFISFDLPFDLGFKGSNQALQRIQSFIKYLWSGRRSPAYIYIQEGGLPLILTMVTDGKYQQAMQSDGEMKILVEHLVYLQDRAENMDW